MGGGEGGNSTLNKQSKNLNHANKKGENSNKQSLNYSNEKEGQVEFFKDYLPLVDKNLSLDEVLCRSFMGSDKRFYRNELCLDDTKGQTLASKALKGLKKQDEARVNKTLGKFTLFGEKDGEL